MRVRCVVTLAFLDLACGTGLESSTASTQDADAAATKETEPRDDARRPPKAAEIPASPDPKSGAGSPEPEAPQEVADPKEPIDPCRKLTEDLEESEEYEVSSCKILAQTGAGEERVAVGELEYFDPIADDCKGLYTLIGRDEIDEIVSQREEPGHRIAYKIGRLKKTAREIRLPVTTTESMFITDDGPRLGKVTEKEVTKQVLVCDIAELLCSLDDR